MPDTQHIEKLIENRNEPYGSRSWRIRQEQVIKDVIKWHKERMAKSNEWWNNRLTQAIQSAETRERERIKSYLFMYTHQWAGDDEQRVCEQCHEVVKRWTVCDASQQKANYLVSELLKALTPKETSK